MIKHFILLPAYLSPEGSEVMKANGGKLYVLKNQIKIYEENNKEPTIIDSSQGNVFLVSDGSINSISSGTMLKMEFKNLEESSEFLQDLHEKSYSSK